MHIFHNFGPALLIASSSFSAAPAFSQSSEPASYSQAVLSIQDAIQRSDLENAKAQLQAAAQRFPANGGVENLLGIVEAQQGHVAQAQAAFGAAIRHNPRLVSPYLNLARLELTTGSAGTRDNALHLYEKVLSLDPTNLEATFESANLLTQAHQYQQSLMRLLHLADDARNNIRVLGVLCADYAGLGQRANTDHCAVLMVDNVELNEDDAAVPLTELREAHRADLIESLYSTAAAHAPLSAAGLRVLGLAQEANGELPAAQATLERVYAMDERSPLPLIDLARIALARQDDQAALGYLAHARALDPKNAALPYQFGVVCFHMNLLGEARKAMGEALELAPTDPEYNLGMGTVTTFAQDPLQALPYLLKYNQLRPADPKGHLTIGIAYARAKDAENARPWLLKAAANLATAAAAHHQLGSLLRQSGQYDQALGELRESDREKKDQPEVIAELGQLYLQMRNYDAARTELTRALALDPESYSANFALLQLYAHDNDPRRPEQARRFDALRDRHEEQYREAMRVIDARPVPEQEHTP